MNGRRQRSRAGICRSGIGGLTPVANRGAGDTVRVIESWGRLWARGAFSAENSRIADEASSSKRERPLGRLCLIRRKEGTSVERGSGNDDRKSDAGL